MYEIINWAFQIYTIMLIVRIVSSWFAEIQDHPIVRFISFYTDPYLNFFRRFIPPIGALDISPIIAFFGLQILEFIVKNILIP
jgi:YggT family protein